MYLDDIDIILGGGWHESVIPVAGDQRLDHFLAEEAVDGFSGGR